LALLASACVTATSEPAGDAPASVVAATADPADDPSARTPAPESAEGVTEGPGVEGPSTGAPAPASPAGTPSAEPPSPSPAVPTPPPRSAEPSIGYIALDETQAFVQAVGVGIRAAANDAGIDLVACDAGWTRAGVEACAAELAAAGVHGVISFQPFVDLAADVCTATGDAPTIGIVYDQGPCQVSQLRIDQFESGRLAGDAMGRLAAERFGCDVAAFLSLESDDRDPIGAARMQGYREGYAAHCELPAITRSLVGAQFLVTARTQVAEQLEQIDGRPILVAAVSDLAVLGAMEAAADAGRERQVWYSGQLADRAIRKEIACDDRYIASVAQFPERLGATLVPALIDAIEGREVAPALEAELALVTADNVRTLFPTTPACDG
jgi:ABC-type sugar transport system substrate-binding protein